jgi:predicted RNase H-like HicB family nuclease
MRKLTVIMEQEENGGYSVCVAESPGCASQGDTWKEALANIREAIALYLWSLQEDGLLSSFEGIGAAG